jgi:hypothetical protein
MKGPGFIGPIVDMFRKPRRSAAVQDAAHVVRAYRPELRDEGLTWWGWQLRDDVDHRFVAVGIDEAEELGVPESRAWVVDVISEHVVWERTIQSHRDVPRSLGQFIRSGG